VQTRNGDSITDRLDKKRPSAFWRAFKTGNVGDKSSPAGRMKLVMLSMLNGTSASIDGWWGRRSDGPRGNRFGYDLMAMPLDALFTNRSSSTFKEVFP